MPVERRGLDTLLAGEPTKPCLYTESSGDPSLRLNPVARGYEPPASSTSYGWRERDSMKGTNPLFMREAYWLLPLSLPESRMNELKRLRDDLTSFWDFFGGTKNNGIGCSSAIKIALLQDYAQRRYFFAQRTPAYERRRQFEKSKASRHSFRSHAHCFVCQSQAMIRHHIISIANGGHNGKRNLVSLCTGCHAQIHTWLAVY